MIAHPIAFGFAVLFGLVAIVGSNISGPAKEGEKPENRGALILMIVLSGIFATAAVWYS
jgi:hypothetical protein